METTSTPKNFFLQIGIIVTLYASIISFLTFLFNLIDKTFPVTSGGFSYYSYDAYGSAMRFAISTLIVMFPLFIWLSRVYRKSVATDPNLKDSKIRKWLLYFTLFLAGLTIAIDLIVLINSFLRGSDITTAFLLKVLVVLVVAAKVFYFYLKDIKGYWEANPAKAKQVAWALSVVVLVAVVGGFFAIGSPTNQQKLGRDSERVSALQDIQWQIVNFYQSKGRLPAALSDLTDPISGYIVPVDPSTGAAYTYSLSDKGPLTFQICAEFETVSSSQTELSQMKGGMMAYPSDVYTANWSHEIGEKCFDRTIDPDKYPVNPKPVR